MRLSLGFRRANSRINSHTLNIFFIQTPNIFIKSLLRKKLRLLGQNKWGEDLQLNKQKIATPPRHNNKAGRPLYIILHAGWKHFREYFVYYGWWWTVNLLFLAEFSKFEAPWAAGPKKIRLYNQWVMRNIQVNAISLYKIIWVEVDMYPLSHCHNPRLT